jgi:hypothetical protein
MVHELLNARGYRRRTWATKDAIVVDRVSSFGAARLRVCWKDARAFQLSYSPKRLPAVESIFTKLSRAGDA